MNATFVAHASHAGEGTEAADGRIVFDRWRLRFESPALTIEIPLTRLQIEIVESEAGAICFRDAEQPDWAVYTFDSNILAHSPLLEQAHTRNQIKALQSQRDVKRRLKITFAVLASFALVALLVSLLMGMIVRSLVARIPVKWEQDLGDTLMAEVKQQARFVQDPRFLARLDRAVDPLVSTLPKTGFEFKFHVLEHPMPNACALPGGHVLVTTALLELADRPEEIAGVVAHELAHVTQKHLFRKVISSAGPYLMFKIFFRGGGGLLGTVSEGSQLLVGQGFSQEYELEADAVGWDSLVAAHIDPRGMIEMLGKLKAFQHNIGADAQIHAFSSHPATAKRIERLEAKWKKLKDKTGFVPLY